MKTFKATKNDQGRTLVKFLYKMFPDVPKSRIEKTFRQKDIKVNGNRVNEKSYKLVFGDVINVYGLFTADKSKKVITADINFNKIYEDNNILIVEKKTGVAVHDEPNCLDNQVLAYLKWTPKDSFKPSHVGRIDKQTSGIMLYAKTYESLRSLNETINQYTKIYEFKSDLKQNITTEYRITHDEDYKREKCGDKGKPTKTIFWIENGKKYAQILTGRKHQIRASLSKLGTPIYGDTKYGGKKADRVFLHSTYLKLDGLKGKLKYLNNQEFWCKPKW